MSHRKLALYTAGCAGGVMLAMAVLSIVTGVTQEAHEHVAVPEAYGISLLEDSRALRPLFALDVAFTILYACFFAALALYLRDRKAPPLLVWLGLGALMVTAVLDLLEDHHILVMLDEVEHRILPTAGEIAFQATESACKFSVSFLGLVLFGLAVPRDRKLGTALFLFLTVGTLLSAVLGYAMPSSSMMTVEAGRWVGFLAGFGLAIAWLRSEPEPA